MSKSRKPVARPTGATTRWARWAEQTIPVAGVPSGVHEVRDDRGRLVEVIVPFWARREVKDHEVPAGIEAVHLIALSAVDYVNALVQMLRAAPVAYEDRHANRLLCAIASLEGALFEMDCSAFASVGEAPRRADGQRALSAHHAVLDMLGWAVTWALRALRNLEQDNGTPLEFFSRLDPERFRGAADVAPRLRAGLDLLESLTTLRHAPDFPERPTPDFPELTGDAKGLRKWTQVADAIGNTSAGGSSVRREGRLLVESGHLEKKPQGYLTTAKGLALLPQSVPEEHTP